LDQLENQSQIALRYTDNPNGSQRDIAGVCDPTGLVFGLMPHPERFVHKTTHPAWTRMAIDAPGSAPAGLRFFTNAVDHVTRDAPITA
jgi:phosphoribosylformylglycinamidine synthase